MYILLTQLGHIISSVSKKYI